MNKKNTVDTAQKSQTTNNIQKENVKNDSKKSKTPVGKVKLLKETEARKKAREEQFFNFRIAALRRRCKRRGLDKNETEELVKKLIEQMKAPKKYHILVMFNSNEFNLVKESVKNANINYNILVSENTKARVSIGYMSLDGDQDVLAKVREIMPPSAKIYPYAKKMEPVLPKAEPKKKKPSNNSKEKAAAAKAARKEKNIRIHRNKKTGKATKRIVLKTLSDVKKRKPSVVVHLKPKKASEGSKTAKKAA